MTKIIWRLPSPVRRSAILIALLAVSPMGYAAGDVEAGRIKAETCIGCHGVESYKNTYPTYRVPKLVGQHADYIAVALKAYRAGEREHPTMRSQAASMTDQDIDDIAAYIGSLKE